MAWMMLEQDVMIPFQTAWTWMADGSAEQMYVEQGVPHVTQGSDPHPQL